MSSPCESQKHARVGEGDAEWVLTTSPTCCFPIRLRRYCSGCMVSRISAPRVRCEECGADSTPVLSAVESIVRLS